MCPNLGDAPRELSTAEPAVGGLTMDAVLFVEFLQGHHVVAPTWNVAGPDGSLLPESLSHQKPLDYQRVERGVFRRRPTFRIEMISDLAGGRPLGTKRRDPLQYLIVMLQLFKASHGSDERTRCHDLACPVASYPGTLGLSKYLNTDAIEHHTGDSPPVPRCGGLRFLEGRHIFCQLADRVHFLRCQPLGLPRKGPLMVIRERLSAGQIGFSVEDG